VPDRLIILGGGVVGVEMAEAYTALGARVTLVEAAERLIAREEPFASEQVRDALAGRGVDIRLGVLAQRVARDGGTVRVELADGSAIEGDEILVATGRRPRTDDLGLETVGLTPGRTVEVDDELRVPGLPWLYAIGDVNGRAADTRRQAPGPRARGPARWRQGDGPATRDGAAARDLHRAPGRGRRGDAR
jgi:dihydrolipoamide dehydrogenase